MRLVVHGGGCCGYYHVFGMGHTPTGRASQCDFIGENLRREGMTNEQALDALLNRWDLFYGDAERGGRRILEVILTENQNRGWQEALEARGFFASVRWNNANTNNLLVQYLRHTGDIRMIPAGDINREVILPPLRREPTVGIPENQAFRSNQLVIAGTRVVRVNGSGGQMAHPVGETATVTRSTDHNGMITVRWDRDGNTGALYVHRFAPLVDEQPQAAPPPPPLEPTVILTEYFAHLRASGRRGPFTTLLEAREAYPRCRRFDRREVMSDGTISFYEDIQE